MTDFLSLNSGIPRAAAESAGGNPSLDIFHQENFETTNASNATKGLNSTYLTAGTPNGVLSDETTTPISKTRSIKYTAGSSSINDWFDFGSKTIDPKQQGISIGIDYWVDATNFSVNFEFVIWDITNGKKLTSILPAPKGDIIVGGTGKTRYSTSVFIPSNCVAISYGFHMTTAPVNTESFLFDDIQLTTNPYNYSNTNERAYASGAGNGGTGFTAGSTNITFTETSDSHGAFDGSTYTVQNSNSVLTVNGNFAATGNANWYTGIYINGSLLKYYIDNAPSSSNRRFTFNLTPEDIEFGDIVSIRIQNGSGTLSNDSTVHWISIVENWTSENVITPTSSGSQTLSFDGLASALTTTSGTIKFGTLVEEGVDTYLSYSNSTGYFTALEDTIVEGSLSGRSDSQVINLQLYKNVSDEKNRVDTVVGRHGAIPISLRLKKDDTFRLQASNAFTSSREVWLNLTARPTNTKALAATPVRRVDYIATGTNYANGQGSSLTYTTIAMDHVLTSGDNFSSVDSDQCTVSDGKYTIKIPIYAWANSSWVDIQLYNTTDNEEMDEAIHVSYHGAAGGGMAGGHYHFTFVFSKVTSFEVRFKTVNTGGSDLYVGRIELNKIR